MKIVISDSKTGKSYQAEIAKDNEAQIVGKKMGDSIDGSLVGAPGYTLELTGGSDASGFPMRKDVIGVRKSKLLLTDGVGFNAEQEGERRRKLVRGNTYSSDIAQVNAKVTKAGPTPLEELLGKKEEKEEKK